MTWPAEPPDGRVPPPGPDPVVTEGTAEPAPPSPVEPGPYSSSRLVYSTAAVRAGPLGHPRVASALFGLTVAFLSGALVSAAAVLSGLMHADPAVRRLSGRDDSGSSAVGYLFIAAVLLAFALLLERGWIVRLHALRPPRPATESTADGDADPFVPGAPPRRTRAERLRRWARARPLIELRWAWTNAPDPTFDAVARLWPAVASLTVALGAVAAGAVLFGDGPLVRVGVRVGLAAEWLLVLTVLLGWGLMRRLGGLAERRAILALVGHPATSVRPDWRFRRTALLAVPVLTALVAGYAAVAAATTDDSIGCLGGQTGCHVVTVPFDRTRPDDGRTLDIVYRVAQSTGAGHRLLIVAVGGPGGSGIAEMTSARLKDIDPTIRDAYDIVFFDQRGVGASGGLHCPEASGDRHSVKSVTEREADARTFAEACVKETGHAPADMAVYATSQAAQDIDSIRAALGVDRFVLYGESYGTRLAQEYAAHHPEHLDALILDGAIDPASDGQTFWSESAAGFDASLKATLVECTSDAKCRDDFGDRDPLTLVRALLRPGSAGTIITIPKATGPETVTVSRAELAGAMEDALYTEHGRAQLQRALASWAQSDTTMLGRLILVDRETSPEARDGSGLANSSLSIASYFAIECADYDYASGAAGAAAFATARDQAEQDGRILDTAVTQDLPCAYWPVHGSPLGPTAIPDVPTLVLAATTDPVTPPGNAERIVARLPNAALVLSIGGPHVTWRRYAACVTTAVEQVLLAQTLPARHSTCPDHVSDPYLRLPPVSTFDSSAIDALDAVYTETYALPEFDIWDGNLPLKVGCANGGTIELRSSGASGPITYVYDQCGIFENDPLNGTGTYDPSDGAFHYDGRIGTDTVVFNEDGRGRRTITGTWHGKQVDEHD